MAKYRIHSVQLQTTDLNGGAAINIGGITQLSVPTGTETLSDDSGDIYDETRSIVSQIPRPTFTTKAIATALSAIGAGGYCILSDGGHPGFRPHFKALNDCKSPPADTDGARYTFGTGLIVPVRLVVRRGQDAQITYAVTGLTDGTNAPFSVAYTGITFPSSLLTQQFTLGVCKIGNFLLPDLDEVSIDFGTIQTKVTPATGSVWADSVAVKKIRPSISFKIFDPTVLDDAKLALAGTAGTHANTKVQLKKRLNLSTFVPNATTQHAYFTMAGLITVPDAATASGDNEATTMCKIESVFDGTNFPIVMNLAAAYSLSA